MRSIVGVSCLLVRVRDGPVGPAPALPGEA